MTDFNDLNLPAGTRLNRVHLAVGFAVLTMGAYAGAFALQVLFLR